MKLMKQGVKLAVILLISWNTLPSAPAGAQTAPGGVILEYRHAEGDQWHLTSRISQEVLYNGTMFHSAEILNKISVEVLASSGGDGRLYNRYQIAERPIGGDIYTWNIDYEAEYSRDARGRLSELEPRPPIPSVRNIPVYPPFPVRIGRRWSEPGEELFNLAPTFGIDEIIEIDFTARYEYLGPEEIDERAMEKVRISAAYSRMLNPAERIRMRPYPVYPLEISGEFLQTVYWDPAAGRNFAEEGRFSYVYRMSNGDSYIFRGTSEGRAVYAEPLDKAALIQEIQGIDNVTAVVVEEGVALTLENIHFLPDSPRMLPGEESKLREIAEVLRRYPERDILVIGHTAEVRSRGDGTALSKERAESAARYFLENGVRSESQIITRGMGHSRPIADNSTEEGRRANRRVEIIIMEN